VQASSEVGLTPSLRCPSFSRPAEDFDSSLSPQLVDGPS
jgi:hypothetical protein